jgi:rSAM/selenodomain-associated transferase 2
MTVSVIIPTLNEAASLGQALHSVRIQKPHEILVADGGSTDNTAKAAEPADRFFRCERGRATQMNAAAAHATGDVLVFLHADCTLGEGALRAAEQCLRRRSVVAGCYSMRVTAPGWLYRCIDASATARVRLTGSIYGDQGLFLRRRDFERLGGFPLLGLMEDVYFSRRLRREGRLTVLSQPIFVSPRRWQRVGLVRQTLRNWALTTAALLGVSPDRLAAHYPVIR